MAVRNESVRLSLDDAGFTTGMAKAAAATKLLDSALGDLDGSNVGTSSGLKNTSRDIDGLGNSARRNGADLDSFTSRLGLLASAVGALGPSLIPIGAVGVPAITGLASQLGFAAIGAGTLVTAMQGVGDALKAVNDAALEPTAANLDKAREAMQRLGPEAQAFVTSFQDIRPVLTEMRDAAAAGWFPGLTESLDSLVELGPRVEAIMRVIGEAGGNLLAEGAGALAGPQWAEFMAFVQNTAPAALENLGRTLGNVTRGLAELWMAFAPLNADFGSFLLDASRGFAAWSDGLSETEGFQDFVEYIRKSGPQVADALGSIGSAAVELVQAFAPLGGGVLKSVSVLADLIGAIANSPIGPPLAALVTAMSAIRLASAAGAGLKVFSAGLTGIKPAADGARLSLVDLGKQMGIIAAAAYAADKGFEIGDSWERYQQATDATAGSVEALAQAFAESNVGAAAKDFDIDLQRLAEDLAENGTQGAYYTEVVTRMSEANKGLGGTFSGLTDLISPVTGDTERAQQAFADLNNIIENNGLILGGERGFLGNMIAARLELGQFADSSANLGQGIAQGIGRAFEDATNSINEFSESFRGLSDLLSDRATLRAFEAAVDGLNASIKENGQNWDESGAKGRANLEALDAIAATAIERADQLFEHGRRAASQGMLTRALEELREFKRENPKAAESVQPLIDKMKRVHQQRMEPKVEIKGAANAIAEAGKVLGSMKKVDQADANPKVVVEGIGAAIGALGSVLGQLNAVDGKVANATVHISRTGSDIATPGFASGGFTGRGRKYEPAGIVHRNEVVLPEDIVKRDWSMLSNRYGHLPGFADGGLVGNTYSSTSTFNLNPFAAAMQDLRSIAAREYDSREVQLDRTDEQFKRILKKREESAQKEFDADKSRLKAMLDVQKAFEEQVAGLFKSDIFASGDEQVYAVFPDGSKVLLEGGLDNVSTADSMYYQQSGATYQTDSGFDPLGGLQGDVANLQEAMRLYQELRRRGFDGPAFRDLAASADVARLREMVAMSNADLQQIETLYNRRDQLANQLGNQVGRDLDPSIAALRADLNKSREQVRLIAADLIHLIKDPGGVTNEIVRLQHVTAQASRGVGQELAEAFNTSVSSGATGRGRR